MEKPRTSYLDLMEIYFNRVDVNTLEMPFGLELKVVDVNKFIRSHIDILRGNPGNYLFRPYFDRLYAVYKHNTK